MNRRISKSFIIGVVLSSALAATAADPTSMMIRVPSKLAKQIAQQSLGKPMPNGDSHIEIDVKKPIKAKVNKINISNLDEVAKVYLGGIFGLNLEKPFRLPIIVKTLKISGAMRVRDIRFSQPRDKNPRQLGVTVKIDIPDVVVRAPEVWAHEDGLLPEQKEAGKDCPMKPIADQEFVRFVGNHVWARNIGARVVKKKEFVGKPTSVIHATGKFGVEILPDSGPDGRLAVTPIAIDIGNLEQVLSETYELDEGRLQMPEVQIRVGDTCYPGDASGAQAIFHSLREKLKLEIIRGVQNDIKKAAMDEATKALVSLDIPAAKGYAFVAEPDFVPQTQIKPTYVDHTYVHHDSRLLSQDFPQEAAPDTQSGESKKNKPIAGVLWEINERLHAESFSVGADGALQLGLEDSLRVNGKTSAAVDPFEIGALPAQSPDALRIILNRSFFEAKADLIAALRAEQTSLLPKEISLGAKGIELHPSTTGKLSLVAHIQVNLRKLTGLKKAIYHLDRFAGNKSGVIEIPAQLDVEPSIVGTGAARRLSLKFVVNTNLLQNEFGEKSNLGKLFPKVTGLLPIVGEKINEKVAEAARKLNEHPYEVDLGPLETAAPIHVDRVFFTGAGSLVVDLSAPNLPEFVKAAKEKKRERLAREAKEKRRE